MLKRANAWLTTGNDAGAPDRLRLAHRTAMPDEARGFLFLYIGGSTVPATGIDIVRISLSDLTDAKFLRPRLPRPRRQVAATTTTCS